jgi:hypothetical protein
VAGLPVIAVRDLIVRRQVDLPPVLTLDDLET